MKLVRYEIDGRCKWGSLEGRHVQPIAGNIFGEFSLCKSKIPVGEVKLLAPSVPSKVVAVGLNYRDHALEMGEELPDCPKIFIKPSTAVIGPFDDIVIPESSRRVDYEAELALVVRRKAKQVLPEEAEDYILDAAASTMSPRETCRGSTDSGPRKSFDTFAPLGPVVDTSVSPKALEISLRVNGELRQHSNTSNLIFSPEQLLSFVSHVMTLLPGDVIATGTRSQGES